MRYFLPCLMLACLVNLASAQTTSISSGATTLTLKTQGSAPSSPPAGYLTIYADTATGLLYTKNSSGTTAGLGGIDATAILALTNTTDATTTTTGALKTAGGLGVAKAAWIGGELHVTVTTDSTSAATGSIQTLGGMGVAKYIHVGTSGGIHVLATTAASATMTPSASLVGSIIAEGGATILKDSWIHGMRVGCGLASTTTNTALGTNTLDATTSGANDTALGYRALRNTTTGSLNTAVGSNALAASVSGATNTAVGASALASVTTSDNTAVGSNALQNLSTGQRSVALGASAGLLNTDSSNVDDALNSIFIGTFTQGMLGGNTNAIVIGYSSASEGNNTTVLGNSSTTRTHIFGNVVADKFISPWTVVSTTYTAVAGDRIQTDTRGGAFTITLPASASEGDTIQIEDGTLDWGTHTLTIARNGLQINGGTSNYSANVIGGKLSLVYITGYGWSIK